MVILSKLQQNFYSMKQAKISCKYLDLIIKACNLISS